MRPRWWFWAWAAGLRGTTVLLWLGGSLLAAGLVYWIQLENLAELLEFGGLGREIILETFPYWWLGGVIILIICGGMLYSKIGENYKKSIKMIALIIGAVITISTLALLWAGYQNELEILLRFI